MFVLGADYWPHVKSRREIVSKFESVCCYAYWYIAVDQQHIPKFVLGKTIMN